MTEMKTVNINVNPTFERTDDADLDDDKKPQEGSEPSYVGQWKEDEENQKFRQVCTAISILSL